MGVIEGEGVGGCNTVGGTEGEETGGCNTVCWTEGEGVGGGGASPFSASICWAAGLMLGGKLSASEGVVAWAVLCAVLC